MKNMANKQSEYMPDLSEISLKEFKNELQTGRLLPSRKPLLDDIDAKFSILSSEEILWLARLVDVSRIKWVGPKLARLIVDTKYDTVEKLAKANPSDLLNAFNKAKKTHKAYQGALGINDIDSWIRQVIKKTPLVIEYK